MNADRRLQTTILAALVTIMARFVVLTQLHVCIYTASASLQALLLYFCQSELQRMIPAAAHFGEVVLLS